MSLFLSELVVLDFQCMYLFIISTVDTILDIVGIVYLTITLMKNIIFEQKLPVTFMLGLCLICFHYLEDVHYSVTMNPLVSNKYSVHNL